MHIYPLKSGRGVDVDAMELDRFGPRGDRRWMLVNESGRFVSQREMGAMTGLSAEPLADGLRLAMGEQSIEVAIPAGDKPLLVDIWDDQVPARDAGPAVAGWLEQVFERPLRLVYMGEDCHRLVDERYARDGETVSFADGFPLLLVSASALEELNSRLTQPVGLDRFRPNLVVEGCKAHAEDGWRRIRIGDVEFEVAKPCARCAVPALDQRTGEKHPELLRALAGYRRREDRQVYFGQNLLYRGGGSLRVGDQVEVLD
jgi:uncharacterized protein YcbX